MAVDTPKQTNMLPQQDGVVVLNKPSGPSSAQCLGTFKRQGQKKIGHAGTLDPMAGGVLVVLLGQATKLSTWLLNSGSKTYSGQIRLGIETDTWDQEGRVVAEKAWSCVTEDVAASEIAAWTKMTEQEVPAYSAAKHNGQPLYKLARKGHDTPVKVKSIQIFEAAALNMSLPYIHFRVSCASGVYIRSLAHSLGQRLGCGAVLTELTREYSQPFGLDQSVTLAEIGEGLSKEHILPLTSALPSWPQVELTHAQAMSVRNGKAIKAQPGATGYAFLCREHKPLAVGLAENSSAGLQWRIERGLWNQ